MVIEDSTLAAGAGGVRQFAEDAYMIETFHDNPPALCRASGNPIGTWYWKFQGAQNCTGPFSDEESALTDAVGPLLQASDEGVWPVRAATHLRSDGSFELVHLDWEQSEAAARLRSSTHDDRGLVADDNRVCVADDELPF
jgi:hypothetical protein